MIEVLEQTRRLAVQVFKDYLVVFVALSCIIGIMIAVSVSILKTRENSSNVEPSLVPTNSPFLFPTSSPIHPTVFPTQSPSNFPTLSPTKNPTSSPTPSPIFLFPDSLSATTFCTKLVNSQVIQGQNNLFTLCLSSSSFFSCNSAGTTQTIACNSFGSNLKCQCQLGSPIDVSSQSVSSVCKSSLATTNCTRLDVDYASILTF